MAYKSFWVLIHLTCAVSIKSKCIYLYSTPLLSLNFTMPALNIGAICCHCLPSVCQWMQSKAFVSSVCHSVQHSLHSTCPRTLVHKQTSNDSLACLLGLGALLGPPTGHQFFLSEARKMTGNKKKRVYYSGKFYSRVYLVFVEIVQYYSWHRAWS